MEIINQGAKEKRSNKHEEKYQLRHVNDLSHFLTESIKPGGDNLDCFDCSLIKYVTVERRISG